MQQKMGEMEEGVMKMKEKLHVGEIDSCLRERNEATQEGNMRENGALSIGELRMELENLEKMVSNSRDELETKDKKIVSLELELVKARKFELALKQKDDSFLEKLNKELRDLSDREKDMKVQLVEYKERIQELEGEVERKKHLESKMVQQNNNKQLEAVTYELERSKNEIISLHEKIESLKGLSEQDNGNSDKEKIRCLKIELQLAKENLAQAQEEERRASLRADSILDEMELLKNEWKMALEAEEKSTKAMEDLALALKEVATEANQTKEKLKITEIELEHVKGEAEQLKEMVRSTNQRYQKMLYEAKQEAELYKNTADRLRVEAEETLLAWNGKEIGFVGCIKRAEEERAMAQHESTKLAESLKAAENMTRAAREETYKLRDILKQAVNEANAAKAAAGIARDENSLLKDYLAEKEEALHFLTRENERLRISEAAAHENVKQLKSLLSSASTDLDKDQQNQMLIFSQDEEEHEKNKNMTRTFSFNLEDLKFMNEPVDEDENVLDEDPEKAEALKGSIFDSNAETPKSEPHTPQRSAFANQIKNVSAFSEDGGTPRAEDFEHLENGHDDPDMDKNSNKKVKTMFRRVGDLLTIRRSFHKKEPSIS